MPIYGTYNNLEKFVLADFRVRQAFREFTNNPKTALISPTLLKALAHHRVGATPKTMGEMRDEIEFQGLAPKVEEAGVGRWKTPINGKVLNDKAQAEEEAAEELLQFYKLINDLSAEVGDIVLPASLQRQAKTPLLQAAALTRLILAKLGEEEDQEEEEDQDGEESGDSEDGDGEDSETDALKRQLLAKAGKGMGRSFAQQMKKQLQQSLNDLELLQENTVQELFNLQKQNTSFEEVLEYVKGGGENQHITKIVKLAQTLEEHTCRIDLDKTVAWIPTPDGNKSLSRLCSMEDLASLPADAWLAGHEYAVYQAINQRYLVEEKYTTEEHISLVYVMLDVSGSMNGNDKYLRGLAAVYHMIEKVRQENLHMLFSFYESNCFPMQVWYPDTLQNIAKEWGAVHTRHFGGGGTNINRALKTAIARYNSQLEALQEKGVRVGGTKRHIVVIHDGEDECSITPEECNGTTVHAILLDKGNAQVERLVKGTGGTLITTF